ncbi:Monocarboxylate transporter 7, partial [Brachionus plicatilis]
IGLSLVYVPTMIATSKWFVKKRLFACSINVLGACLGAVFYPLLTEFILSRYSLFNTLLILSSLQLNTFAGSLLLFDHPSQLLASSGPHTLRQLSTNTNSKANGRRDSETESQTSTSTNPNLTLKQYWRKFVQTRKSHSNTRKNLFHLIAEEKRKTRTLSKSSLEDGFVITTSNNLLAPSENVIVTRQAKLCTTAPNPRPSLITRIANSLRSLTHSSHTSSPKINEPTPLMSVFEGPLHTEAHDAQHPDSDEDDEPNLHGLNANVARLSAKNPRYMSYRNSLTNSVRGSLMECSVPEEECNEEEVNSGCDGACSVDEEEQCGAKRVQRLSKRRSNFSRPRPVLVAYKLSEALKNLPENNVGYSVPTLVNLRRFISTIETASFLNLPLNLEPVEYNLRNSLIKKSTDKYRKRKFNSFGIVYDTATLFLDYLIYVLSVRLLFNRILFILNFSFFLSSTGFVIVLFFIGDYSAKYHLAKLQSTYVLCLIGLSCGLGRIVSTISYKVNESNARGRIFAYVLTLFLISGALFVSVFLCTTLFSFSMFGIAFGIFLGFNLNLRTLFLYDIVGLEWSDDSLFFYGTLVQALGLFFGVPLAETSIINDGLLPIVCDQLVTNYVTSFIYDYSGSVVNVIYTSSILFFLSGFILLPGRNLRSYCTNSIKSLNKFYLQRKNLGYKKINCNILM